MVIHLERIEQNRIFSEIFTLYDYVILGFIRHFVDIFGYKFRKNIIELNIFRNVFTFYDYIILY